MKIQVLTDKVSPGLLQRLHGLDLRVVRESPERIEPLNPDNLECVYLVPLSLSQQEDWPEVRIHLARASRFYVVFGAGLDTRAIVGATRDGAHDVLDEEDSDTRWLQALEQAGQAQKLWFQLYGGVGKPDPRSLVGRSSLMKSLRDSIQRIGPTDVSVLVMGESGTGKERVAEALHKASGKDPFIAVNCAAIPSELLESELFGVVKGAFTGANRDKPGLVEEASGGTLFLDEIGEMEVSLQPKMLRFLETRVARRVGGTREYKANVRVISATNRDLRLEAEQGNFRPDLFYRLSEIILNTPPLRHRLDDVPDLVQLFLVGAAERLGKNFERVEPELISRFQEYRWPGNVRELKQTVERLAIHYDGPIMRASWWDIPGDLTFRGGSKLQQDVSPPPAEGTVHYGTMPVENRAEPLNRKARFAMARHLLEESGGDLGWTAARLGIHPTTLYRWRKEKKV